MSEPIVTLEASQPRRVTAAVILFATGALLIWVAMAHPPASVGWRLYLVAMGAAILWVTVRLWQTTSKSLILTEDGIADSDGRVLCRTEDIREVERGLFAFKPSNGFMVRTHKPLGRAWAPGLWWRFGTRLGVGGVTPAGQGKAMADLLAIRLRAGPSWMDSPE